MRIFSVIVPIFEVEVFVCIRCESVEAQSAFYEKYGAIVEFPYGSRGAYFIPNTNGSSVFIWVFDPQSHASTVFHELVHVAFGICDLRGMGHDEELIAYLMGWLKQNVADRIFFEAEHDQSARTEDTAADT